MHSRLWCAMPLAQLGLLLIHMLAARVLGFLSVWGLVVWQTARSHLSSAQFRGPFAWYQAADECVAPLTCAKLQFSLVFACWFGFSLAHLRYGVCSRRKSFATMTPAAKEDWVFRLQAARRGCPSGLCLSRQGIAKSNFHAEDVC